MGGWAKGRGSGKEGPCAEEEAEGLCSERSLVLGSGRPAPPRSSWGLQPAPCRGLAGGGVVRIFPAAPLGMRFLPRKPEAEGIHLQLWGEAGLARLGGRRENTPTPPSGSQCPTRPALFRGRRPPGQDTPSPGGTESSSGPLHSSSLCRHTLPPGLQGACSAVQGRSAATAWVTAWVTPATQGSSPPNFFPPGASPSRRWPCLLSRRSNKNCS